nr:unnamed protein product [Haemonchus contortus]
MFRSRSLIIFNRGLHAERRLASQDNRHPIPTSKINGTEAAGIEVMRSEQHKQHERSPNDDALTGIVEYLSEKWNNASLS